MYERHKICLDLRPKEKCFRVQQYREGEITELFHEHVPRHRISLDSEIDALRALISHFAEWSGLLILHSRLNSRGGGPEPYPGFMSHVTYPEEGVLRGYFRSGDTTAWSDNVISAGDFRRNGGGADGA